jgi:tetratricopeptide (TPR) repeat protein
VAATGPGELQVRALSGEAWARIKLGEVREGMRLLEQARAYAEDPAISDLDRAEVVFRLGVARYLIASLATAIALFDDALALAERSPLSSDPLRVRILAWRSRCYRRQRDYEAAREDVERALELAQSMDDPASVGEAYFQASLIAERDGHWVLARTYAERAKAQYEALSDRVSVGRLLNNLGGIEFLLGKPEAAVARMREAFAIALEYGDDDEVATVVSSLAQVALRTGDSAGAEANARHALRLLGAREDRTDEIGSARLVLGRALLEQGRLEEAEAALAEAEDTLSQLSSGSHRAAAWMAQGELAERRGDDRDAAALYRRAAEALQDYRF